MNGTEQNIERNFKSSFDAMEEKLAEGYNTPEDMAEFAELSVRTKLAGWAATSELTLRHKLADMALQAVK